MSEHVEPLDARKTRALTLENMKLTREVERLRGHQVLFCENNCFKNQLINLKRERRSNWSGSWHEPVASWRRRKASGGTYRSCILTILMHAGPRKVIMVLLVRSLSDSPFNCLFDGFYQHSITPSSFPIYSRLILSSTRNECVSVWKAWTGAMLMLNPLCSSIIRMSV